jgi:hypothetical protein
MKCRQVRGQRIEEKDEARKENQKVVVALALRALLRPAPRPKRQKSRGAHIGPWCASLVAFWAIRALSSIRASAVFLGSLAVFDF